jgi:hypothetical protein
MTAQGQITSHTMNRRESWANYSNRISRRFTTLEGWRDIGHGFYIAAGSTVSAIAPNPAYDPEYFYHDDEPVRTRLSKPQRASLSYYTSASDLKGTWYDGLSPSAAQEQDWDDGEKQNPFLSPEEHAQNPFGDSNALGARERKSALPEEPFHIFSKRQKWMVIGIIGVAGLFSGLSSNIYFPSLDAISRASPDFRVSSFSWTRIHKTSR